MNSDLISKSILNEIEDVVYIADPKTYELYYMNAYLQKALSNPPEEQWRRKKCYKVLQNLDSPCPFCTNRCLSHDKFYNWEHYNALLDQHYYIQDKLVAFEGIDARLEIAKNITTQKLLEQDLTTRLNEQQALNDCISLLHTAEAPDESISKLLGLVADYHKAERGYIFLLRDGDTRMDNTHEWCASGVEPQIHNLQDLPSAYVDNWFEKYRLVGEFFIDSLTQELDHDTEEYKILQAQGISSLVTAPLCNTDGSFVGFLGVDNPTENIKRTAVIRAVANFVADFLDKNKQMDALYRLSYFDNLTGMQNRHSYSMKIKHLKAAPPQTLGVIYVDINGLKAINDRDGHQAGDCYIRELGTFLADLYTDCGFRIGGDEFVMVCADKERWCFESKLARLEDFIHMGEFPRAAIGYCWREGSCNVTAQIETADRLMYENKKEQYEIFGDKNELFRKKHLAAASHHDPQTGEV